MATRAQPVERLRAFWVVAAVAVLAVVVVALVAPASAPALGDPGLLVRWGLPIVDAVAIVAAATTLGLLVLAAFLVPEHGHTTRRADITRLAGAAGAVWAVSALLRVILTFADISGSSVLSPSFGTQFLTFLWPLETTRVQTISAAIAIVVAVVAVGTASRAVTAWLALATVVGIVVLALTGHAAGSASHETAVNALGVHVLGASVWLGGLVALVMTHRWLDTDLVVTIRRYSVLAAWSVALIGLSGLQQAWIRIGTWDNLSGSAYAAVLVAKVVAFGGLLAFGWRQRARLVRWIGEQPRHEPAFAGFALLETLLLGATAGMSAVLSRMAPPVPDALPDPGVVLDLTGYPDPGPMDGSSWWAAWRIEWLFLAIAVVAVGLYVAGVVRLRRRGDAWPVGRTICWVLGWTLWVYFTNGMPEIWGRVLFSVHMIMHMGIAMIVPLLLVPGAPITLVLRALRARTDGTWGPRELILHAVHSRALVWLANPVVAACLFFFSLALFYWSPLFELALTTHTGHLLMMAHFIITGYLFVWVLIGIDPGPPRWSPLMLLVILFATISFHAFFGVTLTGSTSLLAPDFFTALGLPWGPHPLADQELAGEIAWGVGEAPTLVLAILVARNWVRSDERETIRKDRQADRDHDAELTAYNDYLQSLRAKDS